MKGKEIRIRAYLKHVQYNEQTDRGWMKMGNMRLCLPKIVQIQGPDHGASQPHLFDVLGLVPDHGRVVEGDPLIALEGVGSHAAVRVLDNGPALVEDVVADLVVGEEAPGSGELASRPAALGPGVEAVVGGTGQGKGLAVHGHPEDKLVRGQAALQPVVHREVLRKEKNYGV